MHTCCGLLGEIRGQLVEVSCLLPPWGSWDGTHVIRVDSKYIDLLSHFTN